MIYYIVSSVCIVLLLGILVGSIIHIFRKNGAVRVKAIRDFKKGQCAIVYIPAIPLYWIGLVYSGEGVLPAFFSAVNKVMSLVVLRYETSSVAKLMADNAVYTVAIYFCFALVAANAMMFTFSFLYQNAWLWIKRKRWICANPKKLLIVGDNEDNLKIYNSAKNLSKMIIDNIPDEKGFDLFSKKVLYSSTKKGAEAAKKSITEFLKKIKIDDESADLSKKSEENLVVVINTKNDEQNILYCQEIISCIKSYFGEDITKNPNKMNVYHSQIQIYVFGDPLYEDVYDELVESAKGLVRYINEYRQIAVDFINRYPLTKFMNKNQLNIAESTVNSDVDLNVLMVGFGRVNKQIFLTSVANNQFVSRVNDEVELKLVNYHIYDCKKKKNDKNLNHSLYRFKNEFLKNLGNMSDQYLPLPDFPVNDNYYNIDVNSEDFYNSVRDIVVANHNNLNYVVISFGSDMENIDLAQKLLKKKKEWGIKNLYIFVRVRSGNKNYSIFKNRYKNKCYLIGDESKCVYNINAIDDNMIVKMAKMQNKTYALESKLREKPNKTFSNKDVQDVYIDADYKWYYKKRQFERESNIYAVLSLRSKLHTMGLDYAPLSKIYLKSSVVDKAGYNGIYAKDDPIIPMEKMKIDDKEIVSYGITYKKSRRNNLAIQEHYRWNSFMISKGFVPATKDEILDAGNNGKDYSIRRHGNLTTFKGLIEYRELVANHDKVSEYSRDVIQYDYQLMDDAFWLLSHQNVCIHRRVMRREMPKKSFRIKLKGDTAKTIKIGG